VVGYIAPYWTITANYAFNDAKITKVQLNQILVDKSQMHQDIKEICGQNIPFTKEVYLAWAWVWGLIMWQTAMGLFLTLDLNHRFFQPINYGMLEFIII
jgi:hypothetical protein